ncbi:hypothetical protein [Lysinibacillus capsici]|nr:hypothetical protein [Lysinibacillus capsici]MCT1726429.1 hypothetical protein [Lysinibacillus capsici]
MIILLFSNQYFANVHVENVQKAIEIIFSENAKELSIFWFLTLLGASLELSGVIIMLKVTWESIKYSYYGYSIGSHIVISIIVFAGAFATIFYALKAVIGILLIAVVGIALLIADNKK